jgi:hypothetical protein
VGSRTFKFMKARDHRKICSGLEILMCEVDTYNFIEFQFTKALLKIDWKNFRQRLAPVPQKGD